MPSPLTLGRPPAAFNGLKLSAFWTSLLSNQLRSKIICCLCCRRYLRANVAVIAPFLHASAWRRCATKSTRDLLRHDISPITSDPLATSLRFTALIAARYCFWSSRILALEATWRTLPNSQLPATRFWCIIVLSLTIWGLRLAAGFRSETSKIGCPKRLLRSRKKTAENEPYKLTIDYRPHDDPAERT